jgi:hypothetical protein
MLQYEMAGLKICIRNGQKNRFKRLKPFESVFDGSPDVEIEFQASGNLPTRKYPADESNQDSILLETEYTGGRTVTYIFMKDTQALEYIIEADSGWSHVTVRYHEDDRFIYDIFSEYLGNLILSYKMILTDGIILHASSVSHSGKGIAFTAPSGTGKSTHAAMWVKHHKASIINDDCPAIRFINGSAVIYGTPWNGSYKRSANSSAPLSAVVILERSEQNSIKHLPYEEAIPMLLPRLFLPYHNPVLMDKALENADKIFRPVPIYHLKCRANREATELVHQCII